MPISAPGLPYSSLQGGYSLVRLNFPDDWKIVKGKRVWGCQAGNSYRRARLEKAGSEKQDLPGW